MILLINIYPNNIFNKVCRWNDILNNYLKKLLNLEFYKYNEIYLH